MQEDEDYQDSFDNEPPELTSSSAYATIPQWLHMSGISDRAFRIYCILAQMQGSRGNDAYPSKATLMRMTRSSKMSVLRAMKELETCGAITSIERFRKDGGQMSSSYILHYDNKEIQSTMGKWTDEPPVDPRVAPRGPEGRMGETLGGRMGETHKKHYIEKEPEKKVASPSARSTQPRSLPEKDIASLKEKWAHRWSSPVIERHIENALNHTASRKAIDLKRYVDNWLRNQEKYDWPKGATPVRPIPLATAKVAPTDWDEADG